MINWTNRFFRRYWNKVSKTYAHDRWFKSRVTRFDYEWTKKSLMEALSPSKGDIILEIGCGPGTWTRLINGVPRYFLAIDISDEMVRLAKKCAPDTKFKVRSVMRLNCKKKFGKIFSVRVLEYVFDKRGCVKKLYDMLDDNGKFVIVTKSSPCLWDITSRSEWQCKISPKKLVELLCEAGFRNIRFHIVAIRLPVFASGVYEAKIIPEGFEKYALAFFNVLTKVVKVLPHVPFWLATLSESYIIDAEKRA